MDNKKILVIFALLISPYSDACEKHGFYVKGGYYGQLINTISTLKIKEGKNNTIIDNVKIRNRTIQNIQDQPASKYQPSYIPTFATSIAFGYTNQSGDIGYKVELEGMYSLVRTNNIDLYNGPLILIRPDKDKMEETKEGSKYYGVTISNNRIEDISVIANGYYFWKTKNFSFSPYIGFGIGGTRIKVYEKPSIRPAYQIKAGLNYRITRDTDLYIGYKHFGVIGHHGNYETYCCEAVTSTVSSEYKINILKHKDKADHHTTLSHDFFGTHGVEIGINIHCS
jgi:hypothetical protein